MKMSPIVGKSAAIKDLLAFIKKAAKSDLNVLILGETGVGKELAARMIHSLSERKNNSFIKVNCANLNENLFESELFGYRKGAFTGAIIDKSGLIEEANDGTFFLDEIADITPYIQAKLLNIIEEREIRRLGENKIRKINVRFIFATNKNLYSLVQKNKFRKDLYYRVNILNFYIPPLIERKEDIPVLIQSILKKKILKRSINFRISGAATNKLISYSFPGNVRELENIIERAWTFSDGNRIQEKDIELEIQEYQRYEEIANIPMTIYREIIEKRKDFWEAVHRPFLMRDLNRREAREIISLGLKETNGSYKKLMSLFNLGQNEKNYKKFMDVIRNHNLK